jgi:hypothetical protein
MRRREFITVLGGTVAWSVAAQAQGVLPVIGVLGSASEAAYGERLTQIRKALAEGGFPRAVPLLWNIAGRKVGLIVCRNWQSTSLPAR